MTFILTVLLLTSCAGTLKSVDQTSSFLDNVVSCTPALDPKAPRPAVCGRCRIEVKDGRLFVIDAKNCPAYEVYRCTRKDGGTFLINNLKCRPD
ncbi:MAG: hypothetical protein NZ526_06365 [Aquificaceae bacterium]|nr:hypothetical protein [Aquificaceae bacterium]MDW8096074.1 hypothetical protein [Aquificaceae bacterium]